MLESFRTAAFERNISHYIQKASVTGLTCCAISYKHFAEFKSLYLPAVFKHARHCFVMLLYASRFSLLIVLNDTKRTGVSVEGKWLLKAKSLINLVAELVQVTNPLKYKAST